MRFLFVDKILKLNQGCETIGSKKITLADTFFHKDKEERFALFPCIIGEALGQLCSWNVLKSSGFRYRPVGGVVKEIEIAGYAYLGDEVLLESHIETLDHENAMVSFNGQASVNDNIILKINHSLAPLLPLEEFNHLDQVKADFENLINLNKRHWMPDPSLTLGSGMTTGNLYQAKYDNIISQLPNEIIGEKNIIQNAPYFSTHFPKKPVFPLSLLMEYNLQLAAQLVPDKTWQPISMRRIKIGNFILPGDKVITRIAQVQNHIYKIFNEVGNKKVCTAEVEFGVRA